MKSSLYFAAMFFCIGGGIAAIPIALRIGSIFGSAGGILGGLVGLCIAFGGLALACVCCDRGTSPD